MVFGMKRLNLMGNSIVILYKILKKQKKTKQTVVWKGAQNQFRKGEGVLHNPE